MSSQKYLDRWQDPARYDGELLSSPREYYQAVVFHTRRGPRLASEFAATPKPAAFVPPLAPLNPDDSDVAMTEAPAAGPGPLAAAADVSDITMIDAPALSRSVLGGVPATVLRNYTNGVHWTPPQGYCFPTPRRRLVRSAIKKRMLRPEDHHQRLQWQSILDEQRLAHAATASPSEYFRNVTNANTLANRPRNHVHDRHVAQESSPLAPHHDDAHATVNSHFPTDFTQPTPPRKKSWVFVKGAKASQPTSEPPRPSQLSAPRSRPAASSSQQSPQQRSEAQPRAPPRAPARTAPTEQSPSRKRKMDDRREEEAGAGQHRHAAHQLSHEEMPARRIPGMMATLHVRIKSFLSSIWQLLGRSENSEDRVAVEADSNRHKRRAVSPDPSKEAQQATPGSFTDDYETHELREDAKPPVSTSDPPRPAPAAARAVVAKVPVVRDGKTLKQLIDELTAEAKKRGTAVSPYHTSLQRRSKAQSLRASTRNRTRTISARDQRVGHLIEISHNVIKRHRDAGRPVQRGTTLKQKLQKQEELRKIAAKEAQRRQREEDERWDAQVHAEEQADALAAEKALAALRPPVIQPLSHDWQERIVKTLSSANPQREITTGLDGSVLYGGDFNRILASGGTSAWLNDNAVNAFYASIVERKKALTGWTKASPSAPPFAAFNSQWLSKVSKDPAGMRSIARWSGRMGVKGKKLLDATHIFFPVNSGSHWTLLVISPAAKQIEYLDSLDGSGKQYFKYARDWLAMELEARSDKNPLGYEASEWTEQSGRSAQQNNMNDCGVFACFNGLALAKGRGDSVSREVSAKKMKDARRMLAAVLLNRGFDGIEFEL